MLINKEIFILQYPCGNLSHHSGIILDIRNNMIEHNIPTKGGSSGSPLIKRYNNNLVIGINFGAHKKEIKESEEKKDEPKEELVCNLAIPFDIIIKDIINKLSENNINNIKNIECKNIINLVYYMGEEND